MLITKLIYDQLLILLTVAFSFLRNYIF